MGDNPDRSTLALAALSVSNLEVIESTRTWIGEGSYGEVYKLGIRNDLGVVSASSARILPRSLTSYSVLSKSSSQQKVLRLYGILLFFASLSLGQLLF